MEATQMAHVTAIDDPAKVERVRAVQKASRYFQRHVTEFRRNNVRYVVLHGEKVVATGDTPEEAHEAARKEGHNDSLCVTLLVPREGESFFF